jgi:predicted AlkP superfamily pyrophosphatase or phosphodiesterase
MTKAAIFLMLASWVQAQQQGNHVVLISVDGLAAYHLQDKELHLPNLRELIDGGAWAENSQTVFPSVTHPSHATIITGVSPRKHGVLGNQMTHRETAKSYPIYTRTRKEAIRVRTLFDAAREAGLVTAAFCWPETRGDSSLNFNLLHGHEELNSAEVDRGLLDFLRRARIPIDAYYDWSQERELQGFRDVVLAKSAAEIIRTHRPRLTAIHFTGTDSTQHSWGPQHYRAKEALTRADYAIGLLREAVRQAGFADRTTFVIVADHGFHSVYHEVNLYPLLAKSGLANRIRLRGSGWTVFLEKAASFDAARDGAGLESLLKQILGLPGLHKIVSSEDFHTLGYPRYEEDPHVLGHYMIIPDIDTHLVVDPSSNSVERRPKARPSHGHGYLPDHPHMYPALILSGHRVRQSIRIGRVRNHDVAPTIAELLGLRLPDVEGRILREALAN